MASSQPPLIRSGGDLVINLCSGKGIPIRAVAAQILEQMSNRVQAVVGAIPNREGEMCHQSGNNSRARHLPGWAPRTSFAEGLSRTIEWFYASTRLAGQLA